MASFDPETINLPKSQLSLKPQVLKYGHGVIGKNFYLLLTSYSITISSSIEQTIFFTNVEST